MLSSVSVGSGTGAGVKMGGDIDTWLDVFESGKGTGKGEGRGVTCIAVSEEEPSHGSGKRDTGLIPIGLEGEEMGRGGYEGTGAWMEEFVDMLVEGRRGGRDVRG